MLNKFNTHKNARSFEWFEYIKLHEAMDICILTANCVTWELIQANPKLLNDYINFEINVGEISKATTRTRTNIISIFNDPDKSFNRHDYLNETTLVSKISN